MSSPARSCIASALLGAVAILCAPAQVADFQKGRAPIMEIHDPWRFHTGDDPAGNLGWAQPTFDDSSWKLGRSEQPLDVLGCGYSGMSWYRIQVALPTNPPPLALFVPETGTSFQVFANGRLVGQYGGLPPYEKVYLEHAGATGNTIALGQIFPIPGDISLERGSLVIAIRVWQSSDFSYFCGDFSIDPLRIGEASLISDLRQHRWKDEFWSLSAQNALLLGNLIAALAGLGLFLLRRREREYLWFAAVELLYAANCALNIDPAFHPMSWQLYYVLSGVSLYLQAICLSMLYVTLLKERRGWPFWSSIGSASFGLLMFAPLLTHWMSFPVWIPVIYLAWIPFIVSQLLMLWLPARRGNQDARLLLVPFWLESGATLGVGLLFGLRASGLGGHVIELLAEKWDNLLEWPFPVSVPNIADFLEQLALFAILVLRFARTRRDEERFKGELEAARSVQQVLIPEEIPAIPGLELECIYRPAGQVGGDFFQILPTANNGALIVIGDVSGKGMPAAMAVSLLVGTVRTLAESCDGPAAILARMNQRMLGRSQGGFTTCLALRMYSDGTAIVANAGHLAPYLNAQEIPVDCGLPLGLATESVYTESTFQLDQGQELTLLTDGVAEARAKTGELFGFDRTASISTLSAQHIAATAAAFGQQDDITVLKIRRRPVTEPAEVPLVAAPANSAA